MRTPPVYPIPFAVQLFPSRQIIFGDPLGNLGGLVTADILNRVFGDESCCGDNGPDQIQEQQRIYDIESEQYMIGGMDPIVFLGYRPE